MKNGPIGPHCGDEPTVITRVAHLLMENGWSSARLPGKEELENLFFVVRDEDMQKEVAAGALPGFVRLDIDDDEVDALIVHLRALELACAVIQDHPAARRVRL